MVERLSAIQFLVDGSAFAPSTRAPRNSLSSSPQITRHMAVHARLEIRVAVSLPKGVALGLTRYRVDGRFALRISGAVARNRSSKTWFRRGGCFQKENPAWLPPPASNCLRPPDLDLIRDRGWEVPRLKLRVRSCDPASLV